MGLGDEIMALGRAEREYERTGKPCTIVGMTEAPRDHAAWHGNPAVIPRGGKMIVDGGGARPYIRHWRGKQAIFNTEHTPRAGRIHLSESDRAFNTLGGPYAVVAPHLKKEASPNKNWGAKRWESVIRDFPCPVYQLCETEQVRVIEGAQRIITPDFRAALAIIEGAAVVLCNEGGTHHMAASARVPAVVVFGAFVPPSVTGYEIHYNMDVPTDQGYCGRWEPCPHCRAALDSISPDDVREKAILMLESYDAD